MTRLSVGSFRMASGLIREPGLVSQLPRWVRDASVRKDPLAHRQPWWNYNAVSFVAAHLPQGARVFEYGGGASTLWLRDREAHVTTVEDNEEWLTGLADLVPDADLRFIHSEGRQTESASLDFDSYAHEIDAEPDASIDLVVVDGQARHQCVLAAEPKVRPGGMLLLDDSQFSDTEPPSRGDPTKLRKTYADLPERLPGWQINHLRGLKPGTWMPVQTTVWVKQVS